MAVDLIDRIINSRWIRILFGREFPFDSLLLLWDILFAEDPGLDLVDMICVAMLLRIRWQRKLLATFQSILLLIPASHRIGLFGCTDHASEVPRS